MKLRLKVISILITLAVVASITITAITTTGAQSPAPTSSSADLLNLILEPETGVACQFIGCAQSPFSATISGTPSDISLVYSGDINEDMFAILLGYNGSSIWGRPVLHNLTRGNSRYITAFNKYSNSITTTSSPGDGWANGAARLYVVEERRSLAHSRFGPLAERQSR